MTTAGNDGRSYASSNKVDIELEFLAKEVDLERDRRRKLQERAVQLAKLLEEKAALEALESKQLVKSRKAQEKNIPKGIDLNTSNEKHRQTKGSFAVPSSYMI